MARRPRSLAAQAELADTARYRCPGCGQMVNSDRLEEVLEHHRHVLYPPPQWFQRTPSAAEDAARASSTPDQRLHELPSESYASSIAARLRRYGHG